MWGNLCILWAVGEHHMQRYLSCKVPHSDLGRSISVWVNTILIQGFYKYFCYCHKVILGISHRCPYLKEYSQVLDQKGKGKTVKINVVIPEKKGIQEKIRKADSNNTIWPCGILAAWLTNWDPGGNVFSRRKIYNITVALNAVFILLFATYFKLKYFGCTPVV